MLMVLLLIKNNVRLIFTASDSGLFHRAMAAAWGCFSQQIEMYKIQLLCLRVCDLPSEDLADDGD